jgi:hypothetical protein
MAEAISSDVSPAEAKTARAVEVVGDEAATFNMPISGRPVSGSVEQQRALGVRRRDDGLLRCRRCGRKLMVAYTGNGPLVLRYVCHRSALDNGEPPCITFAGLSLDEAISREILTVLEPAAIEAAVLATEQEALQQDEIMAALKRELEAAQYTARRAEKQYDTTDPDNRLVASELERRWNDALQKVQQLESIAHGKTSMIGLCGIRRLRRPAGPTGIFTKRGWEKQLRIWRCARSRVNVS